MQDEAGWGWKQLAVRVFVACSRMNQVQGEPVREWKQLPAGELVAFGRKNAFPQDRRQTAGKR